MTNIIGNVTVDFKTYNWQESSINDSYADRLLVSRSVSILSNNLDDDGHLFFMFSNYYRITMISITLYEFDEKCIYLQDISIMVINAVFSENQGLFIMNMDRNGKSIDTEKIGSQNLCIDNLVASDDTGNTFLFVCNLTFNDSVIMINCECGSLKLEYIVYITSAVVAAENGVRDLVFRNLTNIIATNCSKFALLWTSDNDESSRFVDDNNGDVELKGKYGMNNFGT